MCGGPAGLIITLSQSKPTQENNVGWHRSGHDIRYYQNCNTVCGWDAPSNLQRSAAWTSIPSLVVLPPAVRRWGSQVNKSRRQYLYTLSWSFTAPHDNDTLFFAHCFPYTYR